MTTATNRDRKIGSLVDKPIDRVGEGGVFVVFVSCLFSFICCELFAYWIVPFWFLLFRLIWHCIVSSYLSLFPYIYLFIYYNYYFWHTSDHCVSLLWIQLLLVYFQLPLDMHRCVGSVIIVLWHVQLPTGIRATLNKEVVSLVIPNNLIWSLLSVRKCIFIKEKTVILHFKSY